MIEVRELVRTFGDKNALKGVSFTAPAGTITGYLGPNGAGKSTTLKILTGLLAPSGGTVKIAGHDVAIAPLEVKRRIGYVPESGALYETLTPLEYLSLVAELHEVDPTLARERIEAWVERFEIQEFRNKRVADLSKGTRQKVCLVSAFLHEPQVLLLDEPLNGLDVNATDVFRAELRRCADEGRTILYSSHILDVVERTCDRVVVLHDGRVVAEDTTDALLKRSGTPQHLTDVFKQLTKGTAE
ncbi:MAG: ABC transporter ATP-binding protein [Myxococcota bacterium]